MYALTRSSSPTSPLRHAAMLALALALAPAAGHAQSAAAYAPLACLILPEKAADLGSPVIGVVETIEVERGDFVKKGQVLARLRAEVERASSSVARSRAEGEADLRGAVAGLDLAQQKLDRAQKLKQENFVSGQAVDFAQSELRVAQERVAQAREMLATSGREVGVTQAQLSQRVLRAPFDGVVVERYATPGERFEDKPLVRLAVISTLRVELVASTALFGKLQLGQELTVHPDLPGAAPRQARIAQIDRVLDPASNTFRVRLDLPNEDASLPAGLRCKVDLGPKPSGTPRAIPQDAAKEAGFSSTEAGAASPTLNPSTRPLPPR